MTKTAGERWLETIVMAGLNSLRENMEGEKLETYEDLYNEHDRVMDFIKRYYANELTVKDLDNPML
tara:strand:- start:214 stop:411 length:198 start_codon:yes stop_codon:yes gene_type:complete